MRNVRTAVLAGAAAILVAGTAVAASQNTRMLTVGLPDGSIARVEYVGDVAPKVIVEPFKELTPIRPSNPFDAAPIAMLEHVSTAIDEQVEAMMRQVQALDARPLTNDGKPNLAAFHGMPRGSMSYSYVATSDGKHSCNRSWQVTSLGETELPKVVTTSSGDCGSVAPGGAQPTWAPARPGKHPVESATHARSVT